MTCLFLNVSCVPITLLTSTSASHTLRICGSNHPGVVQKKDGVKGKISDLICHSHLSLLSLLFFIHCCDVYMRLCSGLVVALGQF